MDLNSFLPRFTPEGRRIEVGFRGEPARVALAMEALRSGVRALGFVWDERAPLRC